jgi:hypothetical protein
MASNTTKKVSYGINRGTGLQSSRPLPALMAAAAEQITGDMPRHQGHKSGWQLGAAPVDQGFGAMAWEVRRRGRTGCRGWGRRRRPTDLQGMVAACRGSPGQRVEALWGGARRGSQERRTAGMRVTCGEGRARMRATAEEGCGRDLGAIEEEGGRGSNCR